MVRAIRGAIQADGNDRDAILAATAELVTEVMERNRLSTDDVISVLFTATPDLTASFHQLNRFFNIAAYNPRGREPVTGVEATDRQRDEGYLFWLAWVSQNTVSLFSSRVSEKVTM